MWWIGCSVVVVALPTTRSSNWEIILFWVPSVAQNGQERSDTFPLWDGVVSLGVFLVLWRANDEIHSFVYLFSISTRTELMHSGN